MSNLENDKNNHTKIYFTSMPHLSPKYEHVMDFGDNTQKELYFKNRNDGYLYANIQYDGGLTYIVVDRHIKNLMNFDYLYFQGVGGKWFFYFITDMLYNTNHTTTILLEIDVFTTYWEDCTIQKCFVERCHVQRWTDDGRPTSNLQDEGVAIGEYEQIGDAEIIAKQNNCVVVAASVPLGVIETTDVGGGTGGGADTSVTYATSGNLWESGKLSSDGFRFIKGFEGYASRAYQDSGGYWTIGYGVTKHGEPSVYNNLYNQQPVSEETCAKVSYDLKNQNYAAKILSACKKLGITKQCQFDALVSVAYNCGTGAITGNNTLTRAIANNPNDESTIRKAWEEFKVTSKGILLSGLVARRKEECNMYFGKDYEVRAIATINSSGNISGTFSGDGWLPNDTTPSVTTQTSEQTDYLGHKAVKNEFGWFLTPVTGYTVTSLFGMRLHPVSGTYKMHNGIDLACASGTSIRADRDGTITKVGYDSSMGNYIYLDANGIRSIFMHLKSHKCTQGQTVKRGDLIGLVGTTGSSTGNHLHWQIQKTSGGSSTAINPIPSAKKGDKG